MACEACNSPKDRSPRFASRLAWPGDPPDSHLKDPPGPFLTGLLWRQRRRHRSPDRPPDVISGRTFSRPWRPGRGRTAFSHDFSCHLANRIRFQKTTDGGCRGRTKSEAFQECTQSLGKMQPLTSPAVDAPCCAARRGPGCRSCSAGCTALPSPRWARSGRDRDAPCGRQPRASPPSRRADAR